MKKFFIGLFRSCRDHDILNLAANMSFFSILSILPLTMIFVSVLAYFMGSNTIVAEMTETVTDVIPGAKDLFVSNIQNLLQHRSTLGIWGTGTLLLISTILFSSIEHACSQIFDTVRRRNFIQMRLFAVAVIAIMLLLLFMPAAIRLVEALLVKLGYTIPLSLFFSRKVFSFIFAILTFAAVIVLVPRHRISWRFALIGGLLFALGISAAKYIFGWYITIALHRYNLIYGSLSVLVLFVIWIYYLSCVFLVSAEVVALLQRRREKNGI